MKNKTIEKPKVTNIILRVDSETWKRFMGLAKFLDIDRAKLLEQAMEEKMNKEMGGE